MPSSTAVITAVTAVTAGEGASGDCPVGGWVAPSPSVFYRRVVFRVLRN
jgi:hypothetical protein